MGKGDKKSKKGKIRMGSFGKVRPRKKAKLTFVAKKVEKKEVEVEVVEKTETKKKTTKKKAAVKKKTATKKAAKKKV
jgi:30S ribosomal protein S31|tara:strand:- start:3178 stop:3408 length:231 start_codon:yes stop_codon:yes gene_type:complete